MSVPGQLMDVKNFYDRAQPSSSGIADLLHLTFARLFESEDAAASAVANVGRFEKKKKKERKESLSKLRPHVF